jgi:hypothetical protein
MTLPHLNHYSSSVDYTWPAEMQTPFLQPSPFVKLPQETDEVHKSTTSSGLKCRENVAGNSTYKNADNQHPSSKISRTFVLK